MKMIIKMFRNVHLILVLILFISFLLDKKSLAYDFFDWYESVPGYEIALMDAEEKGEPLIIYFYLDSDEWSEKMYNDYLASYEVKEYFMEISKVAVDLTSGREEIELAKKMGIENCPAFVISIPSINSDPERIHPFSEKHNMSLGEFLNAVKEYIVYNYNNKAYEFFEKQDYDNSLNYFQKAITFDPENAYSYHAIAVVYQMMANRKNNPDLFINAEENYIRALKIDPELKEAQQELKELQDRMKNLKLK